MILDDLDRYYRMKVKDPQSFIPRPGWNAVKVSWEFRIDDGGKLVSVVPLGTEKMKYKQMLVPEQPSRTSSPKAFFLCDKAAYLIGLDDKRGALLRKKSAKLHHSVLDGVDDLGAHAVLDFYDKHTTFSDIDPETLELLQEGGFIVFRYLPDLTLVHERDAVTRAWEHSLSSDSDDDRIQCAVTGEYGAPAQLFPATRGIPGAQSAGANLISFNQNSFCSYHHNKDDQAKNASISKKAAFNVGTALRYLSTTPEHYVDIGDTRVIYWTEDDSSESLGFVSLFLDPDAANQAAQEDEALLAGLKQRLAGIRRGKDTVPITRSTKFFVMGLTPNNARISLRFFQTGTLGSLEEHFSQYLRDLDLLDSKGESIPSRALRAYLYQTAAQGKKENVPSTLICSSVEAMLRGAPFPPALFNQLLMRTRVDKGYSGSANKYDAIQLRVPMLKACLLRKARWLGDNELERSLTVSLNENNLNAGYLLGRLFAVLEKAQQEAVPGANTTIRDRYIGSASATPARVFPQLLKNGQHHIEKAEYGSLLDRKIQEIIALIDSAEGFPSTLSYDDQGQFFIGYYQQKQALYAKKTTVIQEETNND
jgi:CRISPR-associated protein Csd1